MAKWKCKMCYDHGDDAPTGWAQHYSQRHSDDRSRSATISFGFTSYAPRGKTYSKPSINQPWA